MAANGVKTRHKTYDAYSGKWRRVRDVMAGQDAIYFGGTNYLPKLVEETDPEYKKRLERTPFYNASWRTIAAFVGMMFRKPPILEAPDKLKELLKDVTMSGVSFENFAQDVTLEDIAISRVGVLVDYPNGSLLNADGTPITLAQAEAAGLRPSMTQYKAEQIINWKYAFINNKRVLTQVRLWEEQTTDKNEFETETIPVIRVLDLFFNQYRVRLFREDNEQQIGGDVFPKMNGAPMAEIPFFFIGPDGAESELSEPVLIDLIDLNIKHFQVSADYEHGCHMTGLPTPVVSGVNPDSHAPDGTPVYQKLYIGSTTAWMLPTGAEAKYLEFTGQGLQALENNLDRKERQMASIGARMLTAEKAGVEAAETLAMRHAGENSILAAIAVAVSEGLTKALNVFAQWANINVTEKTLKFEINRDFMPFAITPQALTALLSAVQAGKLSDEAFFDLLKRGDLHESDLTFEEEQSRIDVAEIPAPVGPGGVPAPVKPGDPAPAEPGTKPAPKPGE